MPLWTSVLSVSVLWCTIVEMAVSQDPNTQKVQKNVFIDKTWHANVRGKPIFQFTKQHLSNNKSVKNKSLKMKCRMGTYQLLVELFCCVILVSSVWRNVTVGVNMIIRQLISKPAA